MDISRERHAVAQRVNVYADYVHRSAINSAGVCVPFCRRLNKHEIFNKLRGIFRKVPKLFRNAVVESNGSGRRSAIQLEQKFARSLSLRISQLGYPIL